MNKTELKQCMLEQIERELPKHYDECWKQALKTKLDVRLAIIADLDAKATDIVKFVKCGLPRRYPYTHYAEIARITLSFDEFEKTCPFVIDDILPFLSSEEKSQLVLRQQTYFNNDDFIFYDVNALLKQYIVETFNNAYQAYLSAQLKARYQKFATSCAMTMLIPNAIVHIIDKHLSVDKKDIPDYQKRVIKERDELLEKFNKLHDFVYSDKLESVTLTQCVLLKRQLVTMDTYLNILNERIRDFNAHQETKC